MTNAAIAQRVKRVEEKHAKGSELEQALGLSPEVELEQEEHAGGGIRPVFGYYRTATGEIVVGLTSEMEELYHRREKWEPLPEYGFFDHTTEYTANHPYEAMFMLGGSVEFSVKQVIENGWHVVAPTVPGCLKPLDQNHKKHRKECMRKQRTVLFPQLAESDAKPWPCEYCERIAATKAALRQHMVVMHSDELGELRTGNALAEAMMRGFQAMPQLMAPGAPTAAAPFDPNQEQPVNPAVQVLSIITGAGLTKKQQEALREAGLLPKEGETDGEDTQS